MVVLHALKAAMADLWWAPPSLQTVNRPEVCYTIDRTNRFNRVMRIDSHHPNIQSLVTEVSVAHTNLASQFTTYPEQGDGWWKFLEVHGYEQGQDHDIRYLDLKSVRRPDHPGIVTHTVRTKAELAVLEKIQAMAFEVPYTPSSDAELAFTVQEYQKSEPRAIRVLAMDEASGEVLGTAGMSLFPHLGVSFFFAGGTIPQARNRGVYSALISARIKYAQSRGIEIAGIFARRHSSSPIAARQGFQKCGEMVYWTRD
ncbi:MAG: GNAT family N-acetyltransferase [Myxococcota bacterium]